MSLIGGVDIWMRELKVYWFWGSRRLAQREVVWVIMRSSNPSIGICVADSAQEGSCIRGEGICGWC